MTTIKELKELDANGLLPCPFCKDGETRIDTQSHWTGMRSQIISVSVKHWCPRNPLQSYIEIKAKTREDAIKAWNTRNALPDLIRAIELARDALLGVIRVADRKTVEFDMAHYALSEIRKMEVSE